ncbi:unnamed protein product [Trichobilharzia szidati]|nr:unnamed protein product [Trichobilharzia szidati]
MSNDMINEKEFKQLCRLLQIQTDVTIKDLRKAYYRLAKSCHPDKHPNDESATTHFILVSRAYKTLCNQLDYKNNNNKTKPFSKDTTKSTSQEKRCSIAEQFLSDLKRQDFELSQSTRAYTENKNAYLPIDKLLNHLLEATLLTEGNSKGRTSEKRKTYNPRERLVQSGRPRSTASYGTNQQQYTTRTSQHNDKSIVPYSNDDKQVVVKTPSEELPNECSTHGKHSDLITDDWISEAQNLLDNIKSSRRLSHSTCTPCLNTQYNSDIDKTHLLPVIDNPGIE